MAKIKVSESFFSTQGEGRYVGAPSVFLRTFGCNFRCMNFNRDKNEVMGKHNPDVAVVIQNIDKYNSIADLPIVNSGCDSYMSIYPEFKKFSRDYEVSQLAEELVNLTPYKTFKGIHLVITGGEPLLGWQKQYPELLGILEAEHGLTHVTFETNGTQELSEVLIAFMDYSLIEFHFSVSAKLPNSGEKWEDAIKPNVVDGYSLFGLVDLKFVVDDPNDFSYIQQAIKEFEDSYNGVVYLMPQGGTTGVYQSNAKAIAELALAKGLYFSPRLQCDLFGNAWAT